MSHRIRFLWNRLSYLNTGCFKHLPKRPLQANPQRKYESRYVLGFSLFTWLGFHKKMSSEDELIHTIKHCVLFIQREDYEKAEQLLHVALRQAQQIHHELGITYIYDVMANLALEREQLDKAKTLFVNVTQRIMADGAQEDDPRVVHISAKLARISHLKQEYSTAQLGYDWCLEKLSAIVARDPSEDNIKLLAITEDWYGRLFLDCNKIEQGQKLLISALEKMKRVSSVEPEHIMYQLNDIGTVCIRLGNTDESILYFEEAIKLGKSQQIDDIGTMYVNIGRAYIGKGLMVEARKSCGFGWKLGVRNKNKIVKEEAEQCIKEIKNLTKCIMILFHIKC